MRFCEPKTSLSGHQMTLSRHQTSLSGYQTSLLGHQTRLSGHQKGLSGYFFYHFQCHFVTGALLLLLIGFHGCSLQSGNEKCEKRMQKKKAKMQSLRDFGLYLYILYTKLFSIRNMNLNNT